MFLDIEKKKSKIPFSFLTVPVDEGLDELAAVQLVVAVGVVHFEVVKLQLLLGHVARVNGDLHVFLHAPEK